MYYLQSRYYNPAWGRFISADAYVSTGQGLLGNNMFAYCNNNPVNYCDYTGNIAVPIWDYFRIHQMVQQYIVNDYGYAMEIYIQKKNGHIGRLDLYDVLNNEYYEVKHIIASMSNDTDDQLLEYDGSRISDLRLLEYTINNSPNRGTNRRIRGTFNYKTYIVEYHYQNRGLIVYSIRYNPDAYALLGIAAGLGIASALGSRSSHGAGKDIAYALFDK